MIRPTADRQLQGRFGGGDVRQRIVRCAGKTAARGLVVSSGSANCAMWTARKLNCLRTASYAEFRVADPAWSF